MTEPDWDAIHNKKLAKGQRELGKRCHCGKMRVNHTVQQANQCKKSQGVDTVVTRMSEKDINNAELMKI